MRLCDGMCVCVFGGLCRFLKGFEGFLGGF